MNKQDQKEVLDKIEELSSNDVVINTLLSLAKINARMNTIGTKVSQEYIEETILNNELKALLINIMRFQSERIKLLEKELIEALEE